MNYLDQYEAQHDIYSARIYPIFLNALRKQAEPALIQIDHGNYNYSPEIIRPEVMQTPLMHSYQIVGIFSAKRQYYWMKFNDNKSAIGFLVDKWRLIFRDYALKYAYRIQNKLAETTRNEIRTALSEAYDQTLSVDQTARYVRKKVNGEISKSRATLIARTEATTATNLGKEQGAKSWLSEQGQKGYKQWLGRADSKERPTHIALNNRIIPMEDNFEVGGELAQYPGDDGLSADERCNCRCTTLYMSERRYLRGIVDGSLNL